MGLTRTTLHWLTRWMSLMVAALVLLLWHSNPATGQGIITGSISGTIVDQTDAVIPGAAVTAVNDSTRTTLQAKTNAEGTFLMSNVPIGTYTVAIEASGFGSSKISGVQVVTGNTASIGRQAAHPGIGYTDGSGRGGRRAVAEYGFRSGRDDSRQQAA